MSSSGSNPERAAASTGRSCLNGPPIFLARLDVDVSVTAEVRHLGVSERKAIEVARALAIDARVLVLDEPTSALSGNEVVRVFNLVERLKAEGVAILFITHFIDEIMKLSDDVTVLRSGKHIATDTISAFTPETIVRAMIGTKLELFFPKEAVAIGDVRLRVRGTYRRGLRKRHQFRCAGWRNSGVLRLGGRRAVGDRRYAVRNYTAGARARLPGRRRAQNTIAGGSHQAGNLPCSRGPSPPGPCVALFDPRQRVASGVAGSFGLLGKVQRSREEAIAREYAKKMRVVSSGIEQTAATLSGGNQQKVLLAKWLIPNPKLLILDQPTRGIDVGAKAEIYRSISQLAATASRPS